MSFTFNDSAAVGIVFDDGAADAVISAADSADQVLRGEAGFLDGTMDHAVEDFKGGYAQLFTQACAIRADDRAGLAGVLAALAEDVRQAKLKAQEEKSRLKKLTAWRQRADAREQELASLDPARQSAALLSKVNDPKPEETRVAPPTISAVFSARDRAGSPVDREAEQARLILEDCAGSRPSPAPPRTSWTRSWEESGTRGAHSPHRVPG